MLFCRLLSDKYLLSISDLGVYCSFRATIRHWSLAAVRFFSFFFLSLLKAASFQTGSCSNHCFRRLEGCPLPLKDCSFWSMQCKWFALEDEAMSDLLWYPDKMRQVCIPMKGGGLLWGTLIDGEVREMTLVTAGLTGVCSVGLVAARRASSEASSQAAAG